MLSYCREIAKGTATNVRSDKTNCSTAPVASVSIFLAVLVHSAHTSVCQDLGRARREIDRSGTRNEDGSAATSPAGTIRTYLPIATSPGTTDQWN
jgi:hypothetical protein